MTGGGGMRVRGTVLVSVVTHKIMALSGERRLHLIIKRLFFTEESNKNSVYVNLKHLPNCTQFNC